VEDKNMKDKVITVYNPTTNSITVLQTDEDSIDKENKIAVGYDPNSNEICTCVVIDDEED
jgi:hypothetical protein